MPSYDPDLVEAPKYGVDLHDNVEEWESAFWLDDHAWRFAPYWDGRGLHLELGTRAYLDLVLCARHRVAS